MKYILLFLSIFFVLLVFGQGNGYVFVLSKGDNLMVAFDYKTLDSVATVPISEDPHEIVIDRKELLAYISHPLLMGTGHKISVINLKTLALIKTIDTKPFYTPHGLFYQDDKLWVTAQGAKSVVLYDTKEGEVEQVFGTGQDFTHLIYVPTDGNRFYTTNVESGTISIYEEKEIPPYMPPTNVLPPNAKPRLEWRQTLVDVGSGAEGFDVSPDGKELWTARPDGYIVVVDLDKKEVMTKINTNIPGLHRLKITPDGKTVCIVSVKTGDLLYYNRQARQLEQKDNIGKGAGIYMDKDLNRMFISCTPNNYVIVIDLNTRKIIKKISVARPDAVTSLYVSK